MDYIRRLTYITDRTGAARSTIYDWIGRGIWPPAISLGPRMAGWPESEIASIITARTRGASEDEVRSLVAGLVAARERKAA